MNRKLIIIALVIAIAVALYPAMSSALQQICLKILSMRQDIGLGWLVLLAGAYAILLAIPFVPGLELGLLIMVLFGAPGAIVAHVATVTGLLMSFVVGERMAACSTTKDAAARFMAWAQSKRPKGGEDAGPRHHKLGVALKNYRHLALAILLNLPGNAVIGGGGGIAFLSGASREFAWPAFVLTCALATAPLPLLVIAGKVDPVSFFARAPASSPAR